MEGIYKTYLHTPPHYFLPNAMYMVTGAILHKEHLLSDHQTKAFVLQTLLQRSNLLGWGLQAWAILNNHYHFIARAPDNPKTLTKLIQQFHSLTAIEVNKQDHTPGRQVWQNYWDSCLTHQKSYLARLRYVHENPVKHGVVDHAEDYPFCSYKWFLENGDHKLQEQVFHQPMDRIKVMDDFNMDSASLLAPKREQAP